MNEDAKGSRERMRKERERGDDKANLKTKSEKSMKRKCDGEVALFSRKRLRKFNISKAEYVADRIHQRLPAL